MKINSINNLKFKGARINIVANSDNHGNITTLSNLYAAIKENRKEIFQKSDEPSTLNLYINAGDFFINGAKTGFRSDPSLNNMAVQKDFFQLLINKIKKAATQKQWDGIERERAKAIKNKTTFNEEEYKKSHPVVFDALYTPGNHCYDGGDTLLYDTLDKIDGLTTVITNIDAKKSSAFEKRDFDNNNSHFVTSKEYEIPDDKYEHKKHHLMVLGATIPAMGFYNPELLTETQFVDENEIKDADMSKENIKNTVNEIKKTTLNFKERYPDGIIVLISHMGNRLSKIVRDEVPQIDEILDGHKHDVATFKKGHCNVSSLGEDNKIIKSIALQIDDFGEIERESYVYATDQYEGVSNSLKRMVQGGGIRVTEGRNCYEKEFEPIIHIDTSHWPDQESGLQYNEEIIRRSNSLLANFLTTSIKNSMATIKGLEDVDVVGVQSSIIRGGISEKDSNFNLMKIFDGVSEKLAHVKVGEISGKEMLLVVLENILTNIDDERRNTIIHWSDIQVNKAALKKQFPMLDNIIEGDLDKELENEKEDDKKNKRPKIRRKLIIEMLNKNQDKLSELSQFVQIRQKDGSFAPIQLDQKIKMAIADKYLKKTDIVMPNLIKNKFEDKLYDDSETKLTYHNLLMHYFNNTSQRNRSGLISNVMHPVIKQTTTNLCNDTEQQMKQPQNEDEYLEINYKDTKGGIHKFYIDDNLKNEIRIIEED